MMCAWKELLSILPPWLRREVDMLGKQTLGELRLRINSPPELVLGKGSRWLAKPVTREDISFCVNAASSYSPWAAATSAKGYLTIQGGHRIGLCGEAVCKNGEITGFREIHSLCIRVARDYSGIAQGLGSDGNTLILGAPGWGKTTLLRDLIRNIAQEDTTAVIDERGELFPAGFQRGKRMDVLTGCPKAQGISMALRTMGPAWIAVDEITAQEDCDAMLKAIGCGVRLAATAHASSLEEFLSRPAYSRLWDMRIFQRIVILNANRAYRAERVGEWK